jgi:hypothetical protein
MVNWNDIQMKKIYLLFVLLILFSSSSIAQRTDSTNENQIRVYDYVGIAAGHESLISLLLPKFGFMAMKPLGRNIQGNVTPKFALYAAADVTLFAIVLPFVSGSIYPGVKCGPFTFDTAFSFMNGLAVDDRLDVPHYQSINPKIGIRSEHVWFKFGPSFETRNHGGDGLSDWVEIGKNVYNFDLNFVFEF